MSKNGSIEKISDLIPDAKNARKHNPRNVGLIVDALHEVGAARSGVIDEKGNVLAGNATLEALAQAGIDKVKVVDAAGDEWVVVRRTGLSKKQKQRLALFDNRTGELSAWDYDVLKEFGDDLDKMWSEQEIEAIRKGWLGAAPANPQAIADYDPATETFTIKITGIAAKHKDMLLKKINGLLETLKLKYKADAF